MQGGMCYYVYMISDLEKIKEKILPILKKEGVLRSSIFGSYARGKNNSKSDLDLLVELPEGKSLLDLAGLQLELEEKLNKKVDVLTKDSIHPLIRQSILKNRIAIL